MRLLTRLILALSLLVVGACAPTYHLRPLRDDELRTFAHANGPLLQRLGYAGPRATCKTGIYLSMGVLLTTGALSLPAPELRGLFAHGLAHLQLAHQATTGRRVKTRLGAGTVTEGEQARLYTAEEELEADRYATRMLTEAFGASACPGLTDLLRRALAEGERWREWTTQHPVTPERASAAGVLCTTLR